MGGARNKDLPTPSTRHIIPALLARSAPVRRGSRARPKLVPWLLGPVRPTDHLTPPPPVVSSSSTRGTES